MVAQRRERGTGGSGARENGITWGLTHSHVCFWAANTQTARGWTSWRHPWASLSLHGLESPHGVCVTHGVCVICLGCLYSSSGLQGCMRWGEGRLPAHQVEALSQFSPSLIARHHSCHIQVFRTESVSLAHIRGEKNYSPSFFMERGLKIL